MRTDLLVVCPALVVLISSTIAAITDVHRFKIYNILTVPLIASGLIYHTAVSQTAGLAGSLAGGCLGGGVLLLIYLVGGMGAGDVKLMAGVGTWLGLPAVVDVLIISSLAAGAYAVLMLARYGGVTRTIHNLQVMYYQLRAIGAHLGPEERTESLVQRGDTRRLIPYGAMITVGIIAWIYWRGITR